MDNIYRKNNAKYYDELVSLVHKHPRSYFNILQAKYTKLYNKSFKYLFDWICSLTSSKLDLKKHTISTIVYWILNGITDFPNCKRCGKQIGISLKIQLNGSYPSYCHICARKICGEKSAITFQENVKNDPTYVKRIDEKRKHTNLVNHGIETWNNPSKNAQTCLNRYGVDNVRKTDACKRKIKQSKKEHYGNENFVNTAKSKRTCMQRYGFESAMQNPVIRAKARTKYKYDGKIFDSKMELCYYIWLKDHDIAFTFKPNKAFLYEFEEKQHWYIPDFVVKGQYVEIKGDHFFKEDGTMQNPYDHSQDGLYEAKHQCMIENNVIVMLSSNCDIYVKYVADVYGNDYCKKMKLPILQDEKK